MKPGYDPKTAEEGMTLVVEECAELAMECMRVIQAITKAQRFGLGNWDPRLPLAARPSNAAALVLELYDVRARSRQLLELLGAPVPADT